MKKFYLSSGYLDMRAVLELGVPFIFVIGGRAVGKTYGALQVCLEDHRKFAFMRRTQRQLDIINKPEFSPLKPIMRDSGELYTTKPLASGLAAFLPCRVNDEGDEEISGPPVGITLALSTISNLRGFDASDLDVLIYDEFIPEKSERPLKNEADALFNCYETLNRNRELVGKPPLQMLCLANANDQASPVLLRLGLLRKLDRMASTGQELYLDRKRGLAVLLLMNSDISEAKGKTALYKLTEGSDFAEMALQNRFAYEERASICSRPIHEYRPVCMVGEIVVYKHKAERRFYVTTHKLGSPPSFGIGETELARWQRAFGWLWREYMDDRIDFEDYACQVLFTRYIGA